MIQEGFLFSSLGWGNLQVLQPPLHVLILLWIQLQECLFCFMCCTSTIHGMVVCYYTVLWAGGFSSTCDFSQGKVRKKYRGHLNSHLLPAESSVLCTFFLQSWDCTGTYDCASIPAKPVVGSLTRFLSGGAFRWPLLMPEIKKSMTSQSGLVPSWKVPLRLAQTWETIGLVPINAVESWPAFRSSFF